MCTKCIQLPATMGADTPGSRHLAHCVYSNTDSLNSTSIILASHTHTSYDKASGERPVTVVYTLVAQTLFVLGIVSSHSQMVDMVNKLFGLSRPKL